MSFNLLDLVKDQVSASLVEQASSFLGEDSATIHGDSGKEVDNLAAILKAYSSVNVEIQGYTDNTGD